jgi:hypothetical protein
MVVLSFSLVPRIVLALDAAKTIILVQLFQKGGCSMIQLFQTPEGVAGAALGVLLVLWQVTRPIKKPKRMSMWVIEA